MIIISTAFGKIICENVKTANSLACALYDACDYNKANGYNSRTLVYRGWIKQIHIDEEYNKNVFG